MVAVAKAPAKPTGNATAAEAATSGEG